MPRVQSSVFSRQSSEKSQFAVGSWQLAVISFIKKTAHCSLLTAHSSQRGFAQLALVMLLLVGVAIGTYVVQNRTNISPNAQELGESCSEERRDNECRDDGYIYEIYQDCNGDYRRENTGERCGGGNNTGSSCQYDEKYEEYECKNGYRCWNDYYKSEETLCRWESKDPHFHCDKDDKCGGSSAEVKENSDKSEEDCKKAGGEWRDNRCFTPSSNTGGGTNAPGTQGTSGGNTQYDQSDCRDGAQSYKDGYAWIAYCGQVCQQNSDCAQNTTDGAVDPKTSNWCYGFNGGQAPRCMKLVQTDNKEVADQNRKNTNAKEVEVIKSNLAAGNNPNNSSTSANQSSSVSLRAKVDAQNKQRSDLVGELATILNAGGSTNSTLTASISRAQSLITAAGATSTTCYTGTDKPLNDSCDAQAQAANDVAVAASRVALFDAVAAGIPDTCVKVDMAVGSKTSNSIIEVTPSGGTGVSRLFMCRGKETTIGAKDGDIKWRVRDDKGGLQEVAAESLNRLGLTNSVKNISAVPQDYVTRRNNAATLAGIPAYNASNLTTSTSTNTEWREVAVSNCLNNCSSFPSSAVCYQKGTTTQYNCDGKKPTTAATTSTNTTTTGTKTTTPTTTTEKKNLPKNATCSKNSECKGGQCNPGTSKCN